MVRLKVYYYQTIYPTCGQFQFLMVRLKVFFNLEKFSRKSEFQFLMVRLKVEPQTSNFASNSVFQFLMVRLKAPQIFAWLSKKHISIPYGAIKRETTGVDKLTQRNFNSLWCD